MAIERMKKLHLMAVRAQKEELIRQLMLLGCIEVSEPDISDVGPELRERLHRESGALAALKAERDALTQAIGVLDRLSPEKSKLLSAKPEKSRSELLDLSGLDAALGLAGEINGRDERIRRISAEESRIRGVIESLVPWRELDIPLDCSGTENAAVVFGSVLPQIAAETLTEALGQVSGEAELYEVSEDKAQRYLVLICHRCVLGICLDALREYGFSISSFGGMTGTAAENISALEAELEALAAEKTGLTEQIIADAGHRPELKLCADRLSTRIACAEADEKLLGTDSTVLLRGWALERMVPELEDCLSRYDCAWELTEPEPEEYPDVPIKLRNNKLTNGLNMVTEMYSLPAYDGVDPNPLIAPFFILFYGLMMADMGYGLLMIAAAIVALRKIKPKKGALSFCRLLLSAGISTFVMGALTGGFFGDALEQIGKILELGEGWGHLPSLFNPMTDSMTVLIGAMGLGFIHLNTGMVINAVEKIKRGDIAGAVWEEGSQWVMFLGALLCILKIGNIGGVPVVLVIGILMLFYGGSRDSTGFGKFTSIFGTIYNTATGWFGDILSYSRIMALMLAGSVIATVFNTIGAIANNIIFFAVVFVIGHSLNFALNLLGCYVHDLRLQCLEYFGKFYKDGGRAFDPLEIKTKYYDIADSQM